MSGRFVILVSLLGAALPAHADVCPLNEFSFTNDLVGLTRTATLDTVEASPDLPGTYEITFDLTSGWLRMFSNGNGFPTYVRVRDSYDVAGVPAGTPITVTAELPVSGLVVTEAPCDPTCGIVFYATIRSGTEAQRYQATFEEIVNGGTSPFSGVVRLPVFMVAGQPRVIEFELWTLREFDGRPVLGQGAFGFRGLPPGAAIVSCQGYGGTQVPARATSWGALKTIYR